MYTVEIGQNIVMMRKARGISQEQLALRSNISVTYMRRIEHGTANPSSDILEALAKTLAVEPAVLYLYSKSDAEILDMVHSAQTERKAVAVYA